jgi:hypothetical protein
VKDPATPDNADNTVISLVRIALSWLYDVLDERVRGLYVRRQPTIRIIRLEPTIKEPTWTL